MMHAWKTREMYKDVYGVGVMQENIKIGPRKKKKNMRKVLRPAISTQVFLGFPVPKSKC
jgi:hypothetical protein